MIPALDLFCGLGGWTTGASRTEKVHVRAALNHDETAIAVHSAAHPDTAHFAQDAAEFPFETLRGIVGGGFLLASPSCRDFSSAGRPASAGVGGNGTVDLDALSVRRTAERNTAWAAVSAIESLEPEVCLIENVVEFFSWKLFPAWASSLEALGYSVRTHRLNAADYGGATDRVRGFITARRSGPLVLESQFGAGPGSRSMRDCLDSDEFAGNRWADIESKPPRTRDLIRDKQKSSGMRRGILNNVGDGVRMRLVDELAPTLTTQSGTQLMLVDDDRVRILNPYELSRIMGWEDHEIELPKVRKVASRLVGNAVPVELAQGIAMQALASI